MTENFVLAGLAFILGSVMDTLDGRYSRMSGKGTLFGALLDPVERGGRRADCGRLLLRRQRRPRPRGGLRGDRARLADGLLYARPR
ncbi:MAG TPA: CDP-alcohol phosphatidyltransferase family protein [Solirubrobacterales bacterium]|nr:CDP-alcohol phosphatidyltransferase family protein [Solirubrobacterales bacterium]